MRPITLKDIAIELNISVATASKALKGYHDVGKNTRDAVVNLAEKLHYTPNTIAVNLRTQNTKTIGVVIPTINDAFFAQVIEGVMDEAQKQGYCVITVQSNENLEFEKKQLDFLMQKRVDGILISLSNETHKCDHLKDILQQDIPIVMFDKINKIIDCSKVTINDREAAYNAVTYLIEKGYHKIAHFRGPKTTQISIDRFLGYKKALDDHQIPFDPTLVFVCDGSDGFKEGYTMAQKLIDNKIKVDAVFAITDIIAVGVITCFKENNIQIPKDVAVFGFSNRFMCSIITPSLSTVNQPSYLMGKKALELLIEDITNLIKKKPANYKNLVLPTSLAIRNST